MPEKPNIIKVDNADEIDLLRIFRSVWENRRIIYKSIILFFLLGLIIVFFSPKEYRSEVVLLVETSTSSGMTGLLQQFGGMAGLGGLGSATQEEALTPELYPDIISSTPFLLEIMDHKLTDSKYDSTLTVSEFLDRHTRQSLGQFIAGNTIGLPGKIFGLIKGKSRNIDSPSTIVQQGPLKLTSKQSSMAGRLSNRIKSKEGKSLNTFIISVEMQDPRLAAQLTDSVVKNLTAYIIDYRTQKAKADLEFVKLSHAEAEKKYYGTQRSLAAFKDRNTNIIAASAQITEQNLQAEYTLAFNLYNTLSQQLEQAKLKVQEKTPVFRVMEPAKIPLEKSKPNTKVILLAMIIMGGFVGLARIFGGMILKILKGE